MLPGQGTRANPMTIIPTYGLDQKELEFLIEGTLGKRGASDQQIAEAVEEAELGYEQRVKVAEAQNELRRLMAEKALGRVMMLRGDKKWKSAFYRPIIKR